MPQSVQRDADARSQDAGTTGSCGCSTSCRSKLDTEALRCGWSVFGDANRGIYSTAEFSSPIALDLERLRTAAEMQLNRQQRTPATSLEAVLLELGLKAKKGTKSSDYAGHQAVPGTVVLLERGIIFRWHPPSKD